MEPESTRALSDQSSSPLPAGAAEQGVPVPPKQYAVPPKAKRDDRSNAKPIDQQLKDRIAANRKAAERYIELHRKTDKELKADEEAKELEPGVAENLPESYHNAPVGPNSPEHKTAKDYNSTH